MEINFCDNCDNCMFLYSDEENSKLYLGCKACQTKIPYNQNKCIYTTNYYMDLVKQLIKINFLKEDNTLPTIKGNSNIKCPNQECKSIKRNKSI